VVPLESSLHDVGVPHVGETECPNAHTNVYIRSVYMPSRYSQRQLLWQLGAAAHVNQTHKSEPYAKTHECGAPMLFQHLQTGAIGVYVMVNYTSTICVPLRDTQEAPSTLLKQSETTQGQGMKNTVR
jgi:hypothetical protein